MDTFYYEQLPPFHVVFSSESCLKNFILAIDEVKSALEPKLQALFLNGVLVEAELAQQLTVKVQPSLFLVSPSQQETKGAEINLVTKENFSTFVIQWKDSKLFDFGALYQEDGVYWCQLSCGHLYEFLCADIYHLYAISPNVQSCNEGCVVTNCTNEVISDHAKLTVGK